MEKTALRVVGKPYRMYPVGAVFEASRRDARLLIALGLVEAYQAPPVVVVAEPGDEFRPRMRKQRTPD